MGPPFVLKSGIVSGRSHILYCKNCQDAVRYSSFTKDNAEYHLGFICDGCSSGKYSEVGASLGSTFLLSRTRTLVEAGVPFYVIPMILFQDTLEFLKKTVFLETAEDRSLFIQDFLLFTIVGFISGPNETVVLTAGDGLTLVNDDINQIDCHNEPEYLAYHLVDSTRLLPNHRELHNEFNMSLFDTKTINRLAIGSDGWFDNPELLNDVWGKNHPCSLQRQMNVWSNKDHFFGDDASLVILESTNQ